MDIEMVPACPECGSSNKYRDLRRGETACEDCGLVLEQLVFGEQAFGPAFTGEDDPQPHRGDFYKPGAASKRLTTDIGLPTRRNVEGQGQVGQFRRMRTVNRRYQTTPFERKLDYARGVIFQFAEKLEVPKDIRDGAFNIYAQAAKKDLVRGRKLNPFAAAALYIALRRSGFPRSPVEVATILGVQEKLLNRTFKFLMKELGISLPQNDATDYLLRFCSKLDLSPSTVKSCRVNLQRVLDRDLNQSKRPAGVVGAAIYLTCQDLGLKIRQNQVSKVTGISEVTLRKRVREIAEIIDCDGKLKSPDTNTCDITLAEA